MTSNCTDTNNTVKHFARTVGDILPCGHAAVRAVDSSLICGEPVGRIRCAHCKGRHATVAEVRDCAYYEAEAKAEYEAERAAERFWEQGTEAQQMRYQDELDQEARYLGRFGL